jgi:hypothetical protein
MVKVNGALYDSGDTHRLIEIDVIVIEHARVGPLDRLFVSAKKNTPEREGRWPKKTSLHFDYRRDSTCTRPCIIPSFKYGSNGSNGVSYSSQTVLAGAAQDVSHEST